MSRARKQAPPVGADGRALFRDRIRALCRVPAGDLLPNPRNFRTHDAAQRGAIRGLLDAVGFAGAVLARQTPDGLMLVDGHLRVEEADSTQPIPVLVLDVDADEADMLLATFDQVATLATVDAERQHALVLDLGTRRVEHRIVLELVWPTSPAPSSPTQRELVSPGTPDRVGRAITVTDLQREIIDRAIDACRASVADMGTTEGRCIELICADYLAGA